MAQSAHSAQASVRHACERAAADLGFSTIAYVDRETGKAIARADDESVTLRLAHREMTDAIDVDVLPELCGRIPVAAARGLRRARCDVAVAGRGAAFDEAAAARRIAAHLLRPLAGHLADASLAGLGPVSARVLELLVAGDVDRVAATARPLRVEARRGELWGELSRAAPAPNFFFRGPNRCYLLGMGRGTAAGCHVDSPWRRVATTRSFRVEAGRGVAARASGVAASPRGRPRADGRPGVREASPRGRPGADGATGRPRAGRDGRRSAQAATPPRWASTRATCPPPRTARSSSRPRG